MNGPPKRTYFYKCAVDSCTSLTWFIAHNLTLPVLVFWFWVLTLGLKSRFDAAVGALPKSDQKRNMFERSEFVSFPDFGCAPTGRGVCACMRKPFRRRAACCPNSLLHPAGRRLCQAIRNEGHQSKGYCESSGASGWKEHRITYNVNPNGDVFSWCVAIR